MEPFQAACIQCRSGVDPGENLAAITPLIQEAAASGALYIQTPEMTNLLVSDRRTLMDAVQLEDQDLFVRAGCELANELGVWLHFGSLAILNVDGTVSNRAFMISPAGIITGRYDKIHMFDVDLPDGESWRESNTYRAGSDIITLDLPFAELGMGICYDIRFPHLFRSQAKAGAVVLTAPAAFTRQTGAAHWHVLLRARAIENGAFFVAAAQGGAHQDGRETYGHSMIVDPWGRILAEMDNNDPGWISARIDPDKAMTYRQRIPSLKNERRLSMPETEKFQKSGAEA
ncbi:MAG: carbon-nitrogen hydrolase family protein [Stappiaceae bacterium]